MKHVYWVVYILILLFSLWLLWLASTSASNKEYNKHMCAVYGYEEDCKTRLDSEHMLK